MPKEKNFNPVQAQRKADKAKAIKKGKADIQSRRHEKLARKNPERLQKQIDDLKAVTTSGGKLTQHEEQLLEGLEKELKAVRRARETLGDKAPSFGRGWNRDVDSRQGVLGKRRRGSQGGSSSEEEVTEEVRSIPMPRDTPPPIPKEVLDKWYAKRRAKRNAETNAAAGGDRGSRDGSSKKNDTPAVESKTVYEAKPVVRDLKKEAVTAFVPTSVKTKMDKGKGRGGLMEPEEADELEQQGYLNPGSATNSADRGISETVQPSSANPRKVTMEEVAEDEG